MANQPLNSGVVAMLSVWPWQAFVSLSWRNRWGKVPTEGVRERIYFAWARQVGVASGFRGRGGLAYLWARREELGERTQREHLHVLLGGLPLWFVRDFVLRPRPAIAAWWESHGGGNARTSAVVSVGEVADYFTKECVAGREYELCKFGCSSVMLSQHAQAKLWLDARTAATSSREIKALETNKETPFAKETTALSEHDPRFTVLAGSN